MNTEHPITPPPELVKQWEEQFLERPTINGCFIQSYIATQAARWGADQELEACCAWLNEDWLPYHSKVLRAARRPQPPSLKEQALALLSKTESPVMLGTPEYRLSESDAAVVRRALEVLDD